MDELWDSLIDSVLSGLADAGFWTGAGIATGVIVAGFLIFLFINDLLTKRAKFFEPSKEPATNRGPSSADKFRNCACATVSLFLLALIAIVLVAIFIFAVL